MKRTDAKKSKIGRAVTCAPVKEAELPPASSGVATLPSSAATKYFMPYQTAVIRDESPLVIVEKGRQIGLSYAVSYKAVRLAAHKDAKLDVWVMSRDEIQAKQFLLYCKRWARVLNFACQDLEGVIIDRAKDISAQVLKFANGLCIYCLSSNPDAIVGKSGHVILDEFALHKDQRILYTVAKPVTQWGGTITIISTHRGIGTVFADIIRDIRERGNPMGWSLHTIPIQKAVDEGIVEKINSSSASGTSHRPPESRDEFMARLRRECIDEEQWLQEYCCVPADESSAFISYALITKCEDDKAWQPLDYILNPDLYSEERVTRVPNYPNPEGRVIRAPNDPDDMTPQGLDMGVARISQSAGSQYAGSRGVAELRPPIFLGFDVARKGDLSVIDIEEQVGDVLWERHRIEMRGVTFAEQRARLYELLRLPQVKRCCIDATGMGGQLAEEAQREFGWKVEPIVFTNQSKSDLAYPLRAMHEDAKLRYRRDDKLRADLRGIQKEITVGGHERFAGEAVDSHCDRFWAKALAVCAAATQKQQGWGTGKAAVLI